MRYILTVKEENVVEAFLVYVSFCIGGPGVPRCGYMEDEQGPYATLEECEARVNEIFDYLTVKFPPEHVIAKGSCIKIQGESL